MQVFLCHCQNLSERQPQRCINNCQDERHLPVIYDLVTDDGVIVGNVSVNSKVNYELQVEVRYLFVMTVVTLLEHFKAMIIEDGG